MNKKILLGVIVLLLLVGGAYAMKSKQSSPSGQQTQSQAMGEAVEFAGAMKSGRPTTCTLVKDDDIMAYQLKGKLMHAKITTKVEGLITLSHMLNDGSYLYMWSDGQKQGSKMAIPTEEETRAMTDKAKQYQQSAPKFEGESDYQNFKNQGYTINCQPTTEENSVFTPPTNVEFMDPSAMMKTVPTMGEDGKIDINQLKELQKKYGGTNPENQ